MIAFAKLYAGARVHFLTVIGRLEKRRAVDDADAIFRSGPDAAVGILHDGPHVSAREALGRVFSFGGMAPVPSKMGARAPLLLRRNFLRSVGGAAVANYVSVLERIK